MIVWPGPDSLTQRAGGCYTWSMELVLANLLTFGNRLHLMHGVLHPERAEGAADWAEHNEGIPLPPVNPHAWVEIAADDGRFVLDAVLREGWDLDEHRHLFGAEVIRDYRADVAVEIATRRNNFGPWDKRSLAEWERRQQIARDDPRYAQGAALARLAGRSEASR